MNKPTMAELTRKQAQLAKAQAIIDRVCGTLILTGMVGIITLAIMVRG